MNTNRKPRTAAEGLYLNARRAEILEDRMLALDRYSRLIKLVGDREQDLPYKRLAEQRREMIYGKSSEGSLRREIVIDALQRAQKHFNKGETVAANELWNAIVNEFGKNKELAPLVDQARNRLKRKANSPSE